ncbi:protein serine/threonine kinase [Gracilaria domingensis]|nr:protein serine/threonine kinase [Gracilaria domingensis]
MPAMPASRVMLAHISRKPVKPSAFPVLQTQTRSMKQQSASPVQKDKRSCSQMSVERVHPANSSASIPVTHVHRDSSKRKKGLVHVCLAREIRTLCLAPPNALLVLRARGYWAMVPVPSAPLELTIHRPISRAENVTQTHTRTLRISCGGVSSVAATRLPRAEQRNVWSVPLGRCLSKARTVVKFECGYNRFTVYENESLCRHCMRGSFSRPGSTRCFPCPWGQVYLAETDACGECPIGEYGIHAARCYANNDYDYETPMPEPIEPPISTPEPFEELFASPEFFEEPNAIATADPIWELPGEPGTWAMPSASPAPIENRVESEYEEELTFDFADEH